MYENEYLETQVMTAPGPQLHLMVVDGSIRFARQGKLALQEKDFELSHECLNRSREFLSEMISAFNFSFPAMDQRLCLKVIMVGDSSVGKTSSRLGGTHRTTSRPIHAKERCPNRLGKLKTMITSR